MNTLRALSPLKGTPNAWIPTDKSGSIIWFRADNVSTSGSNVTSWTDMSGNGYDATPVGTAPTVATNVINGQPVVRFVASNTGRLEFAMGIPLTPPGNPNTVVIVTKAAAQLAANNYGCLLTLGTIADPTGAYTSFFNTEDVNYGQLVAGGGTNHLLSETGVGLSTFNYYSSFYTFISQYNGGGDFSIAGNYVWTLDGSINNPISKAGTFGVNVCANTIAAFDANGYYYDGDIAEIIVWNSTLSFDDNNNLHNYLLTRYGIG